MAERQGMRAAAQPSGERARRQLQIAVAAVASILVMGILLLAIIGPPALNGVRVAVTALPASPAPAEATIRAEPGEQRIAAQPSTALPGFNEGRALLPAPDQDLIEKGPNGYLPVIGRDGRQAWQAYARPFDLTDKRPRIAIAISELGPSPTAIDTAINHLPAEVSLAFVPYRPHLGEWISLARAAGHEVLLNLPMEPADYPTNDPGPEALLTALDPPANLERMNWVMSQAAGYVGLVGLMGSRFATSHEDMLPILTALQRRGLLYVDNRATPQSVVADIAHDIGLAVTTANQQLDTDPVRTAIDKKLSDLEDTARSSGVALGITHPYPVVMERIAVWAQSLSDRGIALAPVSAVIDRSQAATKPAAGAETGKPQTASAIAQKPTQ
jgi:polysaccharide deacetylase 2 family uncharacterized protein YibQ